MKILSIVALILVAGSGSASAQTRPFIPQLPQGAPPVHIPGTSNIPQPGTYPVNPGNNLIYQNEYSTYQNPPLLYGEPIQIEQAPSGNCGLIKPGTVSMGCY